MLAAAIAREPTRLGSANPRSQSHPAEWRAVPGSRTSIFMRMVANRDMLDGGSRHDVVQLAPP